MKSAEYGNVSGQDVLPGFVLNLEVIW